MLNIIQGPPLMRSPSRNGNSDRIRGGVTGMSDRILTIHRSIGGWDCSCCNTSHMSKYEYYCITAAYHEYSWVVKIRNTSGQYSGHNTPLGHHTDCGPRGLGQYDGPVGKDCGPHTASSVFLILIPLYVRIQTIHITGSRMTITGIYGPTYECSTYLSKTNFSKYLYIL